MQITSANLEAIRVGFKSTFQNQLDQAEPEWEQVATRVPSSAKSEQYGWIDKLPNVREWIGPRHVQNLSESDYAIKNLDYELTIGVNRNDIDDDTLGVYTPIFQEFGNSVAAWPDQQVFTLLKSGFTTLGYDGQNFFDTDHPVRDKDGVEQSVSNMQAGAQPPWFLLSTRRPLKPLIWQVRKQGEFVALDKPDDPNVFHKKEFQYGWDGRGAAGFGFWQMAFGSQEVLNQANYVAARTAMRNFTGDEGRPLGIVPNLLVVDPSNEQPALELIKAERDAAGATNVNRNQVDILVSQWLNF